MQRKNRFRYGQCKKKSFRICENCTYTKITLINRICLALLIPPSGSLVAQPIFQICLKYINIQFTNIISEIANGTRVQKMRVYLQYCNIYGWKNRIHGFISVVTMEFDTAHTFRCRHSKLHWLLWESPKISIFQMFPELSDKTK